MTAEEMNNDGRPGGLSSVGSSQQAVSPVPASIPDVFWPFRITDYAPSHRQFRLDENLSPEEITAAIGYEPTLREPGGKVTMEWKFWAELTFKKPGGGFGSTSICCKVWDYDQGESRWSAYGWPEAFQQLGLTPLMSKDYGGWVYHEDGNPTLALLAQGIEARQGQDGNRPDRNDESPVACDEPITPIEGTSHAD